ncbi:MULTISPECIES: manganese efflux pump MntP family protein [Brachybacterium]|uniref:Putative manganese efflux pump MntP n=1 Tax=Brachybacterium kimchii TaxID=2942909 RepID=A0ABY4N1R8_9MICO|nr:manganese efflux pump MntP family protein [Brachybacterium kimchii]UQN28483.1 manganese efflux pump MntP family protein [Brachybacterium kimchii]
MTLATTATLLILALGVSADAFAVALGRGLQIRGKLLFNALVLAAAFGVAQAVMPLLGWLLGAAFGTYVDKIDHWIAFGLLAIVGGKMIWEAFRPDDPADELPEDPDHPDHRVTPREVAVLAVATSIDAFAVGISIAFSSLSIWAAVPVIGVVTFVLSFVAVFLGQRIGARFRTPAEVVGGIILILIGLQILLEHLGVL